MDLVVASLALKIAFGESPEKKLLETDSMRIHLSECLRKEIFLFNQKETNEINK